MNDEKANRILARALNYMLRESEGIAVQIDSNLYAVYKKDKELFISEICKGEKCMVSGEVIEDGHRMWTHTDSVH
jgi:hypothetical protein